MSSDKRLVRCFAIKALEGHDGGEPHLHTPFCTQPTYTGEVQQDDPTPHTPKQPVRIVISYVDTEDREVEWDSFHTLDVIPDAIRELTGRALTKAVKITVDGDQPFPFLTGDLA